MQAKTSAQGKKLSVWCVEKMQVHSSKKKKEKEEKRRKDHGLDRLDHLDHLDHSADHVRIRNLPVDLPIWRTGDVA